MASTGGIRAGRAFVELLLNQGPLEKGLRQARAKLQAFSNSVQSMGRNLLNLGAVGAAPLALATATYARFGAQMGEVRAITGATQGQFERLEETARHLGATTSFSASQVAEGMKYLGMAGYNTEQIIAGIPGVLNLARAGAVELGVAADIASDVGSAFGLAAEDIGHIADVMAVTASSANTNIEMMGETLKYAAPLAKAAGQSLEDTATAIGIMGNSGIKASMAGTDLANIMKKVGSEAKDALAGVGVQTTDAEGNIRSVIDVMHELGAATRGMSESERLAFFAKNFDRAAKSAIILADAGAPMDELRDKIGNAEGAAAAMAETMGDNLMGAFVRMSSAFEGVKLAIGKAIDKPLRAVVERVGKVLEEIDKFLTHNQWLVASVAAVSIALISMGAGLLTLGVVAKVAAFGITVLLGVLGALKGVLALFASPLGLIAATAIALGGAFLYFSGAGTWAVQQVSQAIQWLRSSVFPVLESIYAALTSGRFGLAGQILWAGVRVAFFNGMKAILEALKNWESHVAGVFGRVALKARQALLQAYAALPGISKETRAKIGMELLKVGGQLINLSKRDLGKLIDGQLEQAKQDLADLQEEVAAGAKAAETDTGDTGPLPGQQDDLSDRIKQLLNKNNLDGLGSQVQDAWQMAVGTTNSFAADRIGLQARPLEKIQSTLAQMDDKLARLVDQGEEGVVFGD